MRRIFMLLISALFSCGIDRPVEPDAALTFAPHDQVGTCDRRWSSDGVPPNSCDHACAVRPIDLPCADLTRPCNHVDLPCKAAAGPTSPYYDCIATFDADGHRGCCGFRATGDTVPTFFECLPTP